MKRMIIFLFCILASYAHAQEKVNTFHVIDIATNLAVPSVSVVIVRAKLAITTEKDGIFSIPGNLGKMKDTLILSAQNYTTLKLPLYKLDVIDTLYLMKVSVDSVSALSNLPQDSLLNDFNRKDIVNYAGIHTETSLFEYLQLAQRFDVKQSGIQLKGVVVNRLAFSVDFNSAGLEVTTFRVRIYDIDTVTGKPGMDLCRQLIEIKDKDNRQFKINLSQYNIILPHKTFFVAIEWLRDFRNMGYATVYDEKLSRNVQHINYRPAIGISPVKGPKLNIWGLNMKREWKPYTYFLPDFTDLAIKATIAY
ncbi:peptidase associated/transthyretin-like domain-containing protein [Pedobacter psychroterrae]|uniref:Carboxypeptidase-like protein n=1 Tax=Pedobacter psychroterrae TaxID=2530453 RepID=A0A4R0NPM2_9SPHI|nr:hypothetical protein [Pedobacter psychroterrae]TCD01175.1 hypothetical protein EZ437_10445 [Pedobacter psychroterrae]